MRALTCALMSFSSPKQMRDLADLPNISVALAEELRQVGITNQAELVAVGAELAWQRLRRAGLRDCMHTLLALEGAVQGRPWRELACDRKSELVRFGFSESSSNPAALEAVG
jgi:DNA transformation protein